MVSKDAFFWSMYVKMICIFLHGNTVFVWKKSRINSFTRQKGNKQRDEGTKVEGKKEEKQRER